MLERPVLAPAPITSELAHFFVHGSCSFPPPFLQSPHKNFRPIYSHKPMAKMVFDFAEGSAEQKALLGGKGANLAEMTRMGFPVPRGFTISSEACREYLKNKNEFPDELWNDVLKKVAALEQKTGKKFGDATNPLLVSVRSGAAVSMPGMMDTVLNLGLNFETVTALANKSGNERFAWDSFRRFIQMFSDVVLGLPHSEFEAAL